MNLATYSSDVIPNAMYTWNIATNSVAATSSATSVRVIFSLDLFVPRPYCSRIETAPLVRRGLIKSDILVSGALH